MVLRVKGLSLGQTLGQSLGARGVGDEPVAGAGELPPLAEVVPAGPVEGDGADDHALDELEAAAGPGSRPVTERASSWRLLKRNSVDTPSRSTLSGGRPICTCKGGQSRRTRRSNYG